MCFWKYNCDIHWTGYIWVLFELFVVIKSQTENMNMTFVWLSLFEIYLTCVRQKIKLWKKEKKFRLKSLFWYCLDWIYLRFIWPVQTCHFHPIPAIFKFKGHNRKENSKVNRKWQEIHCYCVAWFNKSCWENGMFLH